MRLNEARMTVKETGVNMFRAFKNVVTTVAEMVGYRVSKGKRREKHGRQLK